jgi:prefoldin subunit 5
MKKLNSVHLTLLIVMLALPCAEVHASTLDTIRQSASQGLQKAADWLASSDASSTTKPDDGMLTEILASAEEYASIRSTDKTGPRGWLERVLPGDSEQKRLVERVFTLLTRSEAQGLMQKLLDARQNIQALQEELEKLQLRARTAPETVADWKIWEDSREDVLAKIRAKKTALTVEEDNASRASQALRECLARNQIPLSEEQVEALVMLADGRDLVSIIGISANMSYLVKELETAARTATSRKTLTNYSACFLLTLQSCKLAYERAINNIREDYLVKLAEIRKGAEQTASNAEYMLRDAAEGHRPTLVSNIRVSQASIGAVDQYTQYLERQLVFLDQSLKEIEQSIQVADNTYQTVSNASNLLALADNASQVIARVATLKAPQFSVLHDEPLRQELTRLTLQIQ